MYFWHQERDGAPRGTADIDSVFLAEDWPTLEEARPRIIALDADLRALGLQPDRGEKWKASRTAQFTYRAPGKEARIELLCGQLAFGRRSRRTPAWKLLTLEGRETLYASRLEVLDDVPSWRAITVAMQAEQATIEIPSIPGMMHLKLKAVVDKIGRYADETVPHKRDHELGRLTRHATDFTFLLKWARETPTELAAFNALTRSTPSAGENLKRLRSKIQAERPAPELAQLFLDLRQAIASI